MSFDARKNLTQSKRVLFLTIAAYDAALSESKVMKKLELEGLTKGAVEALFGRQLDWPLLEVLDFSGGKFHLAGLKKILPVLEPLSMLDTLSLSCSNIGVAAARLLADALGHTRIGNLHLGGNKIQDEGLDRILSAENAKHLRKLYIGKSKISDAGFTVLAGFLSRDGIELQVLDVDVNQNREHAQSDGPDEIRRKRMLVKSIQKGSKMENIALGGSERYSREWFDEIYDHVLTMVCDTSNVEGVFNSNHRLSSIMESGFLCYNWRGNVGTALRINRETNAGGSTANAIRRKLQRIYFENPDFNVEYFNDMDVVLMPYVLELVAAGVEDKNAPTYPSNGRSKAPVKHNISGIYRLLRNCHVSELFSFPGPKSISTILWEKDEQIKLLQQTVEQLKRENENLRHAGSTVPNKRSKTC